MFLKKIFNLFLRPVKLRLFKIKWKKLNSHNFTYAVNRFDAKKVSVGKYTYGPIKAKFWEDDKEKITIGDFCSIAEDVVFLAGGNHRFDTISSYPFKAMLRGEKEAFSKGPIIVGDDVWIGTGAVILSGVEIGKGAVIGAGSVVSKNIPPYAIAVGNPIKIIKYRFDENMIEKLLNIDLFDCFENEGLNGMYEDINLLLEKVRL